METKLRQRQRELSTRSNVARYGWRGSSGQLQEVFWHRRIEPEVHSNATEPLSVTRRSIGQPTASGQSAIARSRHLCVSSVASTGSPDSPESTDLAMSVNAAGAVPSAARSPEQVVTPPLAKSRRRICAGDERTGIAASTTPCAAADLRLFPLELIAFNTACRPSSNALRKPASSAW